MSDFLIIGGGINGLLVARELAAAGASLTLVDRGGLGGEASWAGGGIVSPLYPWRYPEPITRLASWAQAYYPRLAEALGQETGIDIELLEGGLLMLDAADEAEALAWAGTRDRTMERLSAKEIYEKETGIAQGFGSGLWMPEVAHVRNPRLCRALGASLAQQPGVEIRTGLDVLELLAKNGRVESLRVRERGTRHEFLIAADSVIVTAGAWTRELLASVSAEASIAPVKGQMLLFKLETPPLSAIVLSAGRYLIPRRDGHVLAGSTLEFAGFDKQATAAARASLLASARALLPELEEVEPVAQWAGLRPGSGDGLPFIGPLPDWDNLYVNAGQYRNGLVLAPASARLLVDLVLERPVFMDADPFLPGSRRVLSPDPAS